MHLRHEHVQHVLLILVALHQLHHVIAWRTVRQWRFAILFGRYRKLLITGPPATGKTTTGAAIGAQYGMSHTDIEPRHKLTGALIRPSSPMVVSWGFTPPGDLSQVRAMLAMGFTLVWLDGDRGASFREYMRRENNGSEALYYWQMYHLTEWAAEITALQPVRVCPFTAGQFRPVGEIAGEIMGERSPAVKASK